jgi:hypothetical protein
MATEKDKQFMAVNSVKKQREDHAHPEAQNPLA